MQHKEVADRVLKAVGGEDNIVAAAHCAIRLRIAANQAKISAKYREKNQAVNANARQYLTKRNRSQF